MQITRTIYLFGSTVFGPYGPMTFAPDGRVTTRYEPAEHSYTVSADGSLTFRDAAGQETSSLVPDGSGGFKPKTGFPHFLFPVFALDPAPQPSRRKPIFVNTVPKAGTYLFARALEEIGYVNSGVHVMDHHLHDNRGVASKDLHWAPEEREVSVSAGPLAALLRSGEFAVGHLGSELSLRDVAAAGCVVINLARDPVTQLVSMYHFRSTAVKPSAESRLYMSVGGVEGFKIFLASSPVRQWLRELAMMIDNHPFLRYEDLVQAKVDRKVVGLRLAHTLSSGLSRALGQKTSTLSNRDRSRDDDYLKDPAVRQYLEDVGALALSERYRAMA